MGHPYLIKLTDQSTVPEVNERVLQTHLLTGVEGAAHDAAEDVEAGGVLCGVLLGRVDHEPSLRVARHHVLVALRVARPAVHLLHLTLQV